MACGGAGSEYRYRIAFKRGDQVTEGKVFDFFGDVPDNVSALLEHIARPGDEIIVTVFSEESE